LFRYAYRGGAKDYFIARSDAELDSILKRACARTSITAFFEANFQLNGVADQNLCGKAIELLPSMATAFDGVDLIRGDGASTELDREHYTCLTKPEEIREWFGNNQGARVLGGAIEFWHDNCARFITVYVPDEDGVVRPGAY
jgi:hypothetical protein